MFSQSDMSAFFLLDGPQIENSNQGASLSESTKECVLILRGQEKSALEIITEETSGHKIKISNFEGLDLDEYKFAKAENCRKNHALCKSGCKEMINAAATVCSEKCIPLSVLWRKCFPSKSYDCEKAQRRLLRMPVACIKLENGVVVVEKSKTNCYSHVISGISQMRKMKPLMSKIDKDIPLNKESCQDLLSSATATSEVQRIKHVIASTHNLSQRQTQSLGIRNLRKRAIQVEEATKTVKNIRSKHKYFAKVEQRAFLSSQALILTRFSQVI